MKDAFSLRVGRAAGTRLALLYRLRQFPIARRAKFLENFGASRAKRRTPAAAAAHPTAHPMATRLEYLGNAQGTPEKRRR